MSHGLDRIRQAAKDKDVRITALLHHVDVELLLPRFLVFRHGDGHDLHHGHDGARMRHRRPEGLFLFFSMFILYLHRNLL
jgi:hypothetical protein